MGISSRRDAGNKLLFLKLGVVKPWLPHLLVIFFVVWPVWQAGFGPCTNLKVV